MTVRDIGYVELYAQDEARSVGYLTNLGFLPVASAPAPGGRSVALSNGPVRLVVTTPTSDIGPVADHLDQHGDGIVDVALVATAAGGDPPVRAVQVVGPVRHTLVPAAPAGSPALPPDRRWSLLPGAASAGSSALPIRALDHVALCVRAGTLDDVAGRYQEALGLTRYSAERIEVGDQAMDSVVVRAPAGGVTFTIVAPDGSRAPGQLDDFLTANGGPGVQHLAFLVDDIVGEVRRARAREVAFLETPDAYYETLSARVGTLTEAVADLRETRVLADRDEWGYLLQIFTRSPYPRRTLFYELIQRHAARGFGSANIRALYEAVERERRTSLVG